MLRSKQTFKIEGTEHVRKVLENAPPKIARQLLRTTVHAIAKAIAGEFRIAVQKHKQTGTLSKAIKYRNRRSTPDRPASSVYADRKGFYWRYLEHGHKGNLAAGIPPAQPTYVFSKTVDAMTPRLPAIYVREFNLKLEKRVMKELKKRGV